MKSFVAVLALSTAQLFAADFLPLAPGNNWTYRDAMTGSTFTVEIGASQIYLNQQVYHVLRGYTPQQLFVRQNQYGNIVYWDEDRNQDVLLISFEYAGGGRFEAPKRICEEDGQVQERRAIHDGPGGRWSVVEIQYRVFRCGDVGDQLEQFAENIGMVRRVVNTFAGPRTYDLVHARIGSQVLTAGSSGSFSVTAAPHPNGWSATLRLNVAQLRLRFPSSQEYDLRLRDTNGTILWTWSANKLFAQVEHVLEIRGGWTATVEVPFPPAIPEGPHVYTLEAWLTTANGEPQVGAVTVVEVPGTVAADARRARTRP